MRVWGAGAMVLTAALTLAGCGGSALKVEPGPSPVAVRTDVPDYLRDVAVARPGKFRPPLRSADILVTGHTGLSARVVARLKSLHGVVAAEQFSMATFYAEEQQVTYAAVNPSTFRRFAPGPTATYQEVWDRLADGEIALTPQLHRSLPLVNDFVSIGNDQGAQRAHVGSYADLVLNSRIGALVNERWAAKLGMPTGNAMLISSGGNDPAPLLAKVRRYIGKGTSVQRLALSLGGDVQSAVLTGGSVARAVGSFTYTANPNGSVNPDSGWIRQYIRTEKVPILGYVTCNKAMIPQLRGALNTIVQRGLASKINASQYGGCYVPRFIASDPSQGLSFHTWGTAIDLNVPGNQRGTAGTMDRTVVQIFQDWGFNWGGSWQYTDPMHFELARIVKAQ
jgi:hypothetical protein